MKTTDESIVLNRMAAWASTAERCVYDVKRKLSQTDLPQEAQARIIDRLIKEKFIDEHRYARSFVSDKLRFNKWGRVKIMLELKRRQIPAPILKEARDSIDETTYQTILFDLLKKEKKRREPKGEKSEQDERVLFQKLLRFAQGRGFEGYETIACLCELFDGNDYECDIDNEGDME